MDRQSATSNIGKLLNEIKLLKLEKFNWITE